MKSIYQRIGSQIKANRKKAGLTQEELAEKVGITPAHFNRIERARQDPSIKTLCKIADVLSIDICNFFLPETSDERFDVKSLPLKELIQVLEDRPRKDIQLILEITQKICKEIDENRETKAKK